MRHYTSIIQAKWKPLRTFLHEGWNDTRGSLLIYGKDFKSYDLARKAMPCVSNNLLIMYFLSGVLQMSTPGL
ncbi:conserved hypothetical protein [Ricinus communis]|uniref:Uncharacterized protein n=1 Tax=Ricinus communis TaxID=3988 RepID=B9RUE3_RICCO|nr:conserved hypothetical protein [Ricinus communis]